MQHRASPRTPLWLPVCLLLITTSGCDDPPAEPVASAVTGPRLGTPVSFGNLEVVVLGWSELEPGEGAPQRPKAQRWVVVDVVATNKTDQPQASAFALAAQLRAGEERYPAPLMLQNLCPARIPNGDLLRPGHKIRGQVLFQIPVAPRPLTLVLGGKLFTTGPDVEIALGERPQTVQLPPRSSRASAPAAAAIGTPVTVKPGLTLTVHGLTRLPGVGDTQPPSGNEFVAVDVSLQNSSAAPQRINRLGVKLRDGTDRTYSATLMGPDVLLAQLKSDFKAGPVPPGATRRGKLAFMVTRGVSALRFQYQPSFMGQDSFLFQLPPLSPRTPVEDVTALRAAAKVAAKERAARIKAAAQPVLVAKTVRFEEVLTVLGDMRLAALGWRYRKGRSDKPPAAGNRFVAVEVLFRNDSKTSVRGALGDWVLAGVFCLRDAGGRLYRPSFLAQSVVSPNALVDHSYINPGEPVRGELVFELPSTVERFGLVFRGSRFADKGPDVQIDLQPRPGARPAPRALTDWSVSARQAVKGPEFEVTVRWARFAPAVKASYGGALQPGPGRQFLVVDVDILNHTTKAVEVPRADSLFGGKDERLGPAAIASATQLIEGGDEARGTLAPGETKRSKLVLSVARDAKRVLLTVNLLPKAFLKLTPGSE